MYHVPMVVVNDGNSERAYDIYSLLLKERIIMLNGTIEDQLSASITSQLLYLDNVEKKDINLYINSPGGVITSGMAILDTMNFIKSDVSTICIGQAASMASILLAAGTKGKRFMLPSASVMIHQPSGGMHGQATDMKIAVDRILKLRNNINGIMADYTGQTIEKIANDMERDSWLDAQETLEYGIVDKIITSNAKNR